MRIVIFTSFNTNNKWNYAAFYMYTFINEYIHV